MSQKESPLMTAAPEKLSGHDLVNYLIANPGARGNFKYSSLRSCMWRDLLIAQPGFADVAEFGKIWHYDIFKILLEQPQLAPHFDFSKLWDGESRTLFLKRPEIATPETTAHLYSSTWSEILKKHPHLAHLCPLKKLYPGNWVTLISGQLSFAEQCPWHQFDYFDWRAIVKEKPVCLKYLKLEYLNSESSLFEILKNCYFGSSLSCKQGSEKGISDAASYLIYKRMDRENSKRFLKKLIQKNNWELADQLAAVSPADVLDLYGRKYIDFYMTLMAPDSVFEKLCSIFDLTEKDPAGNTHLLAALVRGLYHNDMSRYNLLLKKGLDPDGKNTAGFSCNDLVAHFEDLKAKIEAARIARNERARERARERRKQAKKGNKNVR